MEVLLKYSNKTYTRLIIKTLRIRKKLANVFYAKNILYTNSPKLSTTYMVRTYVRSKFRC